MMNDCFSQAKIRARQKLNSLPPKQAQAVVEGVLQASSLKPDISQAVDREDLPLPLFWDRISMKKSPEELKGILSKIPANSEAVLVGGHAINLWATHYRERIPELEKYLPFSSEDLDFIGGKVEAVEFQQNLGGELTFPESFSPSPNTAVLITKVEKNNLRIDFLATAYGLNTEQIEASAVLFSSEKLAGVGIKVLNPILCLTGKLKSYAGLPQIGRQDKKHLEIAIPIARQYISEVCENNIPRDGLRLIETIAKLSRTEAGLKVWQQDRIDIIEAIPSDKLESLPGEKWQKLRTIRMPQLLAQINDKRGKYQKLIEERDFRRTKIELDRDSDS